MSDLNEFQIKDPHYDRLIIKQPQYDCPVHGTVVGAIIVSNVIDGITQRFCMRCCLEKIIEIGVCEVTEKQP